jgi:hypothetical protein
MLLLIKLEVCAWARVAHSCNPSYLGGRDQEDHCSKPPQANGLQDPILKKTHHTKRAGGSRCRS